MSDPLPELPHFAALLLRTVLGDRADSLPPEQAEVLAGEFMRGGTHAVLAHMGSASEAAAAVAHARRLSGMARDRLSTQTTPLSESVFVEPEWTAAVSAIESYRDELTQTPGVVGFGPGFRHRGGIRTEERCVVVYVTQKRTPSQLRKARRSAVAPVLTAADGTAVPTDVVQLGKIRRQVTAGSSVGPGGRSRRGTIGAIVDDLARGGKAALTARHVLGQSAAPGDACVSPAHGQAGSAPLGSFRRGTMNRIDAAVIGVERASSTDNTIPELGTIRGWRPVSLPGDYDRTVRMRGAQTRRVVTGTVIEPLVHLPDENLESAILVRIESDEGDSGAALVDSNRLVVGFLVGEAGPPDRPIRIFTPASLVMQLLACDLPPTF